MLSWTFSPPKSGRYQANFCGQCEEAAGFRCRSCVQDRNSVFGDDYSLCSRLAVNRFALRTPLSMTLVWGSGFSLVTRAIGERSIGFSCGQQEKAERGNICPFRCSLALWPRSGRKLRFEMLLDGEKVAEYPHLF